MPYNPASSKEDQLPACQNSPRPLRIALVAHLSEVSGSGVALLEVARGLDPRLFNTLLVLPGHGPLEKRAADSGIHPYVVPNEERSFGGLGPFGRLRMAAGRAGYLARLAAFFRQERIDLVYVNSTASVFAGLAARSAGRPIVWHVHETLDQPTRAARLKMQVIERLSRGIIYASETAQACFPAPRISRRMIARNHVPAREIADTPPATDADLTGLGIPPGNALILANGVIRRKGPDLLLRALAIVRNTRPDGIHLLLLGEGSADSAEFVHSLPPLADRLGVTDQVTFAGLRRDVIPLLRRADLFVSASRNEALPIAVIEAMAAGTPVVATTVGDCALVLDHGNLGTVVPPEDPTALAAGILAVLENPASAATRALNAREQILARYGGPDFWKPLEEFLLSLASTSRPSA